MPLKVIESVQFQCQAAAVRRVETVPNSRTRNQETPIAKSSVCSRNSEDVGVSGACTNVIYYNYYKAQIDCSSGYIGACTPHNPGLQNIATLSA